MLNKQEYSPESSVTDPKKIPKGQKRQQYNAKFKLLVVQYAKDHGNRAASRHFETSESNIRLWIRQEGQLSNVSSTTQSFRGPQKGYFNDIEKQLVEFIKEQRSNSMPVTISIMRRKALSLAESTNSPTSTNSFKASYGWCLRMMKRNGFSLRQRTSLELKLPDDFNEAFSGSDNSVFDSDDELDLVTLNNDTQI